MHVTQIQCLHHPALTGKSPFEKIKQEV